MEAALNCVALKLSSRMYKSRKRTGRDGSRSVKHVALFLLCVFTEFPFICFNSVFCFIIDSCLIQTPSLRCAVIALLANSFCTMVHLGSAKIPHQTYVFYL